jgi:hypothetical protein
MAALLVQMGFGYSDYKDIGFRMTQSHHKAFWSKVGSLVDTSPVGDFGPFGQRTTYIPPRLGLVGVQCGKSALLGGVDASCKSDIAEILRSPRGISASGMVPTRLKITAPLGGSIQRDITSPDIRLLIWRIRNKCP